MTEHENLPSLGRQNRRSFLKTFAAAAGGAAAVGHCRWPAPFTPPAAT